MDGKLQAGKYVGISEAALPVTWHHVSGTGFSQGHVPRLSLGVLGGHDIADDVGSPGIQDT